MSDEQTIYISPEDDLTTLRERLEQIPARKIRLVIPSQTQLRSHVAWKLLYARVRELNKEVVIVSTDPQVRSVAHAVKFKVVHSLESSSDSGRPKGGSRTGTGRSHSGASRSRPTVPPSSATTAQAMTAKEPTSRREGSRSPRSTRPPLSGQPPTWSELNSFLPPEPSDSSPSRFDEPHTAKPNEPRSKGLNLPERNGMREERSSQIYDYRPEVSSAIQPLPINQIEEPDLLIEDYNQAQNIIQAATGSHPVIQTPEDAGPAVVPFDNASMPMPEGNEKGGAGVGTGPGTRAGQGTRAGTSPAPTVYGEDDPFIYMQDDSQPPFQSEQKGEAILQDDEISQDFPLPQPSKISDLPTNVIESEITYLGDDDDSVILFPVSSSPVVQASSHALPFDEEEDETAENRPAHLSLRPYGVPPWDTHEDTQPLPGQAFDEEEDQLPPLPEPSVPTHAPEPISLPMPRARSKPIAPLSRPLSPRPDVGGVPNADPGPRVDPVPRADRGPRANPVPRANPSSTTRNGMRVPQPAGNRPAPQAIQPRGGPARPKSALNKNTRRPATRSRSPRPRRLYLILASILVLFIILFAVAYLNTASTVQITVATQDYTHTVALTLSNTNQSNTVPAKSTQHISTQTVSETATGATMQGTNYAKGNVYFTNNGTVSVMIPNQTVLATINNVNFVTTANALVLPQSANTAPVPVPIQAVNQGISGNVGGNTITVIPSDSLSTIAQAQSPAVTADSLKTTLKVTNPVAITGGEAHQVPAVAQNDLDKAKSDLNTQAQADINAWAQQIQQHNAKNGLVGQPVTINTQMNLPALDTPEPNTTFSANISVTATILVAQVTDAQRIAANQLNTFVQAAQQFGHNFAIIGSVTIDPTQQTVSNGNTVTVKAAGKAGPNLKTTDLQNSLKGKLLTDARSLLRQQNRRIQKVDIQTQPSIFWWVSPWADHIQVHIVSAT